MTLKRAPLFLLASVLGTACIGLGDGVLRVRGHLAPIDHQVCELHLVLHPGGEIFDSTEISSDFSESFVIAPRKRDYRLRVECLGGSTFVTSPFSASGATYSHEPLDLGEIRLHSEADSEKSNALSRGRGLASRLAYRAASENRQPI